jgi:hypothetical protein
LSIAYIEPDTIVPRAKRSNTPKPVAAIEGPQKIKHPYYNYGKALSHNATYNFIVGGRGLGKTYGAKRLAIRAYLKNRDMFVYLRRHKEELTSRDTFFADIQHEFPDWDFRANGNTFEAAPAHTRDDRKRPWDVMGYAIALSTAQKQKGVAFPRVKLIIFDEFILENGLVHYLPDEANVFNNFYSTVDRWQDKTKVLFLANAVSISNPYFLNYKIEVKAEDEFIKLNDGFILCHFPNSAEFAASVMETRFGKFIDKTEYAKYAVANEFADNHGELVKPKDPRARFRYNLETRMGSFSIWHNQLAGEYYAFAHQAPGQLSFTMVPEAVAPDKALLFYNDAMIQQLRTAYRFARVNFDSPTTRNIFLDVFNKKQ